MRWWWWPTRLISQGRTHGLPLLFLALLVEVSWRQCEKLASRPSFFMTNGQETIITLARKHVSQNRLWNASSNAHQKSIVFQRFQNWRENHIAAVVLILKNCFELENSRASKLAFTSLQLKLKIAIQWRFSVHHQVFKRVSWLESRLKMLCLLLWWQRMSLSKGIIVASPSENVVVTPALVQNEYFL